MSKSFYKNFEVDIEHDVYEPQEDSFLLADTVHTKIGNTVLDLGCGAGLVSLMAASQGAVVTAADISEKALSLAKKNLKNHGYDIKTIQTNMFSNITQAYDYIFFNPPYLPHEHLDEVIAKKEPYLVKAWDGGDKGRKFIDIFLKEFNSHLTKKGKAYLLNSSLNDIEQTRAYLDDNDF